MKLGFLLTTIVIGNGLAIVAAVASFLFTRTQGIAVEEVGIFFGKALFTFDCFGQRVRVGCIPTGTCVKFDVDEFRRRSLIQRLSGLLVMSLTIAAFALVTLGPKRAFHHFSSGFLQLPMGALHPFSAGQQLIATAHKVYSTSVWIWLGIVAAKITAANFIPVISSNFAQLVQEAFRLYDERGVASVIITVCILLNLAMMVMWVVSAIRYGVT